MSFDPEESPFLFKSPINAIHTAKDKPSGVWIVLGGDYGESFKAAFDDELEARRFAMQNYYSRVEFFKYGQEIYT